MTHPDPHQAAVARTLPPPAARRGGLPASWLFASVSVLLVWLFGSLVDRSSVAYGQTVPGAPQAVSTTAGTVAKRRPQLAADPVTGGVYLVWEEGVTGTNNGNLYFAFRDPGTGSWTAPSLVVNPAAVDYTPRWSPIGTLVNESHAHIQVDSAGNLHVVYSAWRNNVVGIGAYYTVATAATSPGTVNWTAPVRLDKSSYAPSVDGYLLNSDNTRLFVRDDPAGAYAAVGYVLWTGNTGNQLRLTRVGYGPHGPVTALDATPLTNPVNTSVGPVAVLEIDSATLQLVYAGRSLSTGNGFWGAPLQLNGGGAPTWGLPADGTHRVFLAGTNGNDCSVSLCTGATAARDDSGNTWVAANYDVGAAHSIEATRHDDTPATSPLSVNELSDTPKAGRQPVVVFESNPPTATAVVVYNQCTYVSTSSCTGKDVYYRVHDGATWGPANLTGSTTGEQQDLTAVMVGDDLYYAWVGVNQGGTGTGQQTYFHWVAAP